MADIGAVEDGVGDVVSFQALLPDSSPEMESRTGEAEEVPRQTFVHGCEEFDLVLLVLGEIQSSQWLRAEALKEGFA